MQAQVQKKQEDKSQVNSKNSSQKKEEGTLEFFDQRPEVSFHLGIQKKADTSARANKVTSFQDKADASVSGNQPVQMKKFLERESPAQQKSNSPQSNENKTGLPDELKSGMESLSGISLDDVTVHRNSKEPEKLQAHAYAQGTSIHVGPGQEQHLPHEAWHVVQQKQGRVKPTVKVNGDVPVNDSQSLEQEATTMGQKALSTTAQNSKGPVNQASIQSPTAQLWSMSSLWGGASEKAKKYYDEEKGYTKEGDQIKDKKHEGGFLKGAVGGALGTVGGILGGTLGGLWGAGKSMFGKSDVKKDGKKKGFFEQIRSSASEFGTTGRDMGRVAGAGIVDGAKGLAGGVTGLATGAVGGVVGAIGGGIYGGIKGAFGHGDRKFTGKAGETNDNVKRKGILEQMWQSGKEGAGFGAKGGQALGKGAVDAGFGLVDETPELAINSGRAAMGAAGGVVGAIGGGIYGGVKGAFGHGDRKFTGKAGETNDNVERKGVFEQMLQSGKEGMHYGARKGANSNLTKKVVGGAVSMAAASAGTLLGGPVGGMAAGYAANHANARYWGESNTSADIAALAGTGAAVTSGLITPGLSGINNAAELYSAKGGNSLAGIAAGQGANILEQNFNPEDRPNETVTAPAPIAAEPKKEDTRGWRDKVKDGASYAGNKAWDLSAQGIKLGKDWTADLGNEVAEPYTLGNKADSQFERIKGLFGFGKKKNKEN